MSATYNKHCSGRGPVLFVAFELGWTKWHLAFGSGRDGRCRRRQIDARNLVALRVELAQARKAFGLPEEIPVVSCYEAGRDGFWLHRYLEHAGIRNLVVDSSSIEVDRRRRRAKSDRLDAGKLLKMLMRYEAGERDTWSVVNPPGVEDEERRQLQRELRTLRKDRTRHTNRIKGWLAGCGLQVEVSGAFLDRLGELRQWDGSPVGPNLQRRIKREFARRELVDQQIRAIERERAGLIRQSRERHVEQVKRLMRLRGIGPTSAWLLVTEFFSWRQIRNRRELGSLAGLTPTPYASGDDRREQGISKAGNRWVRGILIDLAWGWLRFQPESELSRWFQRRFGGGGRRQRKIGIVALARKLLVKLWQYLEQGVVPEGAVLKV